MQTAVSGCAPVTVKGQSPADGSESTAPEAQAFLQLLQSTRCIWAFCDKNL